MGGRRTKLPLSSSGSPWSPHVNAQSFGGDPPGRGPRYALVLDGDMPGLGAWLLRGRGMCAISSAASLLRTGTRRRPHTRPNIRARRRRDGQGSGHRPRHDELRDRRHGGRPTDGDPQRRGIAHHALGRRLHRERRTARRPACPAPGHPQPQGHDLLGQAVHRPPLRRGHERDQHRDVRRRARPGRVGAFQGAGQAVRAGGDLRDGPAQARRRRREVPGRAGHGSRHHGAGVLQRRAAPGHQGRRPDRGARGPPDHQRAHRRGPRLRPRQARPRDGSRLRPRRRDLRREPARRRRRRGRGAVDVRGHPPRRRRLRPAHRRPHRRGLPEAGGHRPAQGPAGPAAAVRGGGEGEGGALLRDADHDQPSLRDGRRERPQAPEHDLDALDVRADHGRPRRAVPWARSSGR